MLVVLAMLVVCAAAQAKAHAGAKRQRDWTSRIDRARPERARAAVVGGHLAAHGQFPWIARVVAHRGKLIDACTGTVVEASLILTAAHCVQEVQGGVLAGAGVFEVWIETDLGGRVTTRPAQVSQVLVYPGYRPAAGVGDVALLELAAPAAAPSIPFASEAAAWQPGTPALMAGWGRAGAVTARASTPFLRWANTVVQSPQWCAQRLRGFFAQSQLCVMNAPSDNTAGCAGDSGGPLLVRRDGQTVEVGVLDGSVRSEAKVVTCLTDEPTVYASSSAIAGWVHGWIERVSVVPLSVSE